MLCILRRRQVINTFRKVCTNEYTKYLSKNYTNLSRTSVFIENRTYTLHQNLVSICYKHKKANRQEELSTTDEEDNDEIDNDPLDKHNKLINCKVNSLRTDVIIKAGLGIARNKIETMFYESKIRINGQKVLKKSETLSVGDEIDLIKGYSSTNPNFLTVARVEILSSTEKGEGFSVKLRRNKSLIVENYANEHAWKG